MVVVLVIVMVKVVMMVFMAMIVLMVSHNTLLSDMSTHSSGSLDAFS